MQSGPDFRHRRLSYLVSEERLAKNLGIPVPDLRRIERSKWIPFNQYQEMLRTIKRIRLQ